MSDDIRTGRKARKILIIMAAVFAVAMMLAVPLVVAVDSEADFTKDEKGFCVTYTNPTDAQVSAEYKKDLLLLTLFQDMAIFNTGIFGEPTISNDPVNIKLAEGQKIDTDTKTKISDYEISADKITITITALFSSTLISPAIDDMPSVYKDAADAIKAEFGNEVSNGDTVTIAGSLNIRMAEQQETKYNLLDENKCVKSKVVSSSYYVKSIDMTLTFKHGSNAAKSVKLFSDLKGMLGDELSYEYASSPITVGTKFTVKDTVSTLNVTGDTHYVVGDKNYTMVYTPTPNPDAPGEVIALTDQSSIKVDQDLIDNIANLPAPADNITVDKTYGGAQSAFDGVVMDAVGNDLLKLILIIVGVVIGVIVLIVILIIVVIVLKKKKK